MELGHGFVRGENRITRPKVRFWLHTEEEINWNAFLWYIAQYITIIDYDENSFVAEVLSIKQREWFYKKVMEYNDEIGAHNYLIDKADDMYKSQHRGYQRNSHILERLVLENI